MHLSQKNGKSTRYFAPLIAQISNRPKSKALVHNNGLLHRYELRGEADKFGKLDILNGPGKITFLDLKPGIIEEH